MLWIPALLRTIEPRRSVAQGHPGPISTTSSQKRYKFILKGYAPRPRIPPRPATLTLLHRLRQNSQPWFCNRIKEAPKSNILQVDTHFPTASAPGNIGHGLFPSSERKYAGRQSSKTSRLMSEKDPTNWTQGTKHAEMVPAEEQEFETVSRSTSGSNEILDAPPPHADFDFRCQGLGLSLSLKIHPPTPGISHALASLSITR